MTSNLLGQANRILLFLILLFSGLYFGAPFLIPIAYAIILSMLLLPLRKKLEKMGIKRTWSTLLCVSLLFFILLSIVTVVGNQMVNLYEDLPRIERLANQKYIILQTYLHEQWNISERQLNQIMASFALEEQRARVELILTSFAGYLADIFLILIYVYVFLYFKAHFEKFILKLVPNHKNVKAHKIMDEASNVAERYLVGKLILMLFLCLIYSVGFFIIGINHALFYAILAAVLSLIPYLGNIIGAALPVTMAMIEKDIFTGLAVVGLFFIVQFIETYVFEPLIVGRNVNLNPPFTILIIVLGGVVWGVSGMILAIPYLGILQIVFCSIEPLKPFGYLIGDTERKHDDWIYKLMKKIQ